MADNIITTENKKTVEEVSGGYAKTAEQLSKDYAAASEVMDITKAELDHGQQQNTEFSNSGLNTTVAKDSKGNTIGTYDWEAQAEHTAKIVYNSDVLAAKEDAAAAKKDLVANQQQGQTQHDMASYSANQSAEKAGWTGGYVLDSNRQVAFLKESIKANLYSQEELQKYGYDTALAAARANYDLKKSELAMQNYNTAVQNAFQMAEFTGKFISPEASFHLSQLNVAEEMSKSTNPEDKARAEEVKTSVNSWFKNNGVSKEGVYCMSVLMQNYVQASNVVTNISNALINNAEAWDKFNAMIASNQQTANIENETSLSTGIFAYVDEYGEIKHITANYAEAATSGKIPENLSADAKIAYTAKLGRFISAQVNSQVTSDASSLNFKSEKDAKAWIEADLKEKLKNIKADNITIDTFNVTCKVNGEDITIAIGGDTVKDRKNSTASKENIVTATTTSTTNTDGSSTAMGADGKVYKTTSTKYSGEQYLKGLDNIEAGQNFHIKKAGADWDLEIWDTIDEKTAKNQGLNIDSITTTGLYHVNNTNNYIKDYIEKELDLVYAPEYAAKGTVYYVKVNTDGTKSICIVGSQKHSGSKFANNYGEFINTFN